MYRATWRSKQPKSSQERAATQVRTNPWQAAEEVRWAERFSLRVGLGRFCPALPCRVCLGIRPLQRAGSRGNLARLQAAIVRVKRVRTRSMPRNTVWAILPIVLAQPKGCPIFFRRFCERALPAWRVVRPMAECRALRAICGVTQACLSAAAKSALPPKSCATCPCPVAVPGGHCAQPAQDRKDLFIGAYAAPLGPRSPLHQCI